MLDAEEVAAIREAMGQAAQVPDTATPGPAQDRDAIPIALIAEDRAAVQARPNGLKLASRWARFTKKQLGRMTGAKIDLDVLGAESVEASSLREELMLAWTGCVGAADRAGTALVAISGPMIETLAARLLGAPSQEGQAQTDRTPSSVALRLFESVGDGILRALCEAWREEQGCTATIADAARAGKARAELTTDGIVLLVTLAVRGAAAGQIRIICRPETLIAPTPPVEAVPAAPGLIEDALGAVPVDVAVELGRARLTLSELGALRPGAVITLDRFVDDPLPVEVQGVVKAHGRAMVARNAMAVEIAARKEAA
jgi:flagellar motor switch protein FliM